MVGQSISRCFAARQSKWLVSSGLAVLASLSVTSVSAAPASKSTPSATQLEFIPSTPPGADRGSTTHKVQLGNRGDCLPLLQPETGYLTALIPESAMEYTTADRPSLWVYIPDAAEDISQIVLTLRHRQNRQIQRVNLTLPQLSPGVVQISWPETMAPLAEGDTYDWAISLVDRCDQGETRYVMGTIQRQSLTPDLEQQLNTAPTQRDQAAAYAQHGIWYDALTQLGAAYQADADNPQLAADWASLLKALELDFTAYGIPFNSDTIANQPLLNCCSDTSEVANSGH